MTQRSTQKVKVGVVGCGVVATAYYLPYLMRHADIVAVCDVSEERAAAAARLFGAPKHYHDYFEMLDKSDLEAVFILTGPGTHARFAVAAASAGRHFLLQKPMATTLDDAEAIVGAVRSTGVKALVEPSANSPLDPDYRHLQELMRAGVLGDIHWFSLIDTGPTEYGPGLGMNPYGAAAFFAADSGGFLFDYAYAPSQIATLLGNCMTVSGAARTSVPEGWIVPDEAYTMFLNEATDPDAANYWDTVLDLPKTEHVLVEAADNVFSTYGMENGSIGCLHVGRIYHPAPKGPQHGLQIYGSSGTLVIGGGYTASIISERSDLVTPTGDDGWYRLPLRGQVGAGKWPKPTPGAFNYYEASSQHLLDCIVEDQEPVVGVEWGRHITEMMFGALQSANTGCQYDMTTRLPEGA